MEKKKMKKINRKEEGISALEYALIALLVALAIIAGAAFLGTEMNTSYNNAATILQGNN